MSKLKDNEKKTNKIKVQYWFELQDFQNGKPVRNGERPIQYSQLIKQISKQFQTNRDQYQDNSANISDEVKKINQPRYIKPKNQKVQNLNYGQKIISDQKVSTDIKKGQPKKTQIEKPKIGQKNDIPARKNKGYNIPEMMVMCNHCTFEQSVPANTQVFVCCCCNNLNQCFPLYGLFICGKCKSKICYPYGTSEMIRCSKCQAVNKVPTQPKKRFIPELQKLEKMNNAERQKVEHDFADSYFNNKTNSEIMPVGQEKVVEKDYDKMTEEQLLLAALAFEQQEMKQQKQYNS